MSSLQPRAGLAAIGTHMGRLEGLGHPGTVRLCSNENPFGPSPRAVAAAAAAMHRGHEYPEDEGADLAAAIAARHGLEPARVRLGGGTDPMLLALVLAHAGPGDEVVFPANGYARYSRYAAIAGAVPVAVPDDGSLRVDPAALAGATTPRTRVVVLANPDNPSGATLPAAAVAALHARLPDGVLLVLDGAYAEYVRDPAYGDGGLALASRAANVAVSRTFSKIHGLAGLRLGWLAGAPGILAAMGKAGPTFPVSIPALAAGAAALDDTGHAAAGRAHNDEWLPWLAARLAAHPALRVYPSQANFLLVRFPTTPGRTAAECAAALATRGLLVRRFTNPAFAEHLRVTIGPGPAMRSLADAVDRFMA